ncbi:MAG: acyl-CoA thioesterase [Spirosomataceae bacterium]
MISTEYLGDMRTIDELITLIQGKPLDEQTFWAENYQAPWKRVFGGQVLAQSLSAAYQTVDDDRWVHSLHAYFLLTGDIGIPIRLEVERVRDGGSFTTRRVVAKQNEDVIFILSASFQKSQPGFTHQIPMPNIIGPDHLRSDQELLDSYQKWLPNSVVESVLTRPFIFKPVESLVPPRGEVRPPFRHVWLKAKDVVESNDLRIHQQLLTYVSDYNLLSTATLPHTQEVFPKDLFMASLDHAMWFHRPFRVDDWLLFKIESPSASNSRGLTQGHFFTQDGTLVATVVQEGLIRQKK